MTKNYQIGSKVLVRLYDGRELPGVVKQISDTVAGRKIHVHVQFMSLVLNAERIIKVLDEN
jgi:hypothetical protein